MYGLPCCAHLAQLTPPWLPKVVGDTDTQNISPEFVREPPQVTPSPAGSKLKDATGTTPPSFKGFTYTQENPLDGTTTTYRCVSWCPPPICLASSLACCLLSGYHSLMKCLMACEMAFPCHPRNSSQSSHPRLLGRKPSSACSQFF